MKQILYFLFLCTFLVRVSFAQQSYTNINPDTIKALPFDNGKMWTFDFPPTDYFSKTYGFTPDQKWYDDVRLSSLRFGMGCSASFISEDGLIITNFHCSQNLLSNVEKEGENFLKTGFYAQKPEDERNCPRLAVNQLIDMQDVTKEVSDAFNSGKTTVEKNQLKAAKIKELEGNTGGDNSLTKRVVSFYNGGRYSLYTYKMYRDIRLVLVPEFQLGMFGGDPDNYTYPRYSLDYTLWRAYENGKPVKVKNFFKMSDKPLDSDEVLFVVGNPGRTNKQKTVAQLEYMRDYSYFYGTIINTELQDIYQEMAVEFPEKYNEYSLAFSNTANGTKRYAGVLRGLRNPVYMGRKKDFERQFQEKVNSESSLKSKYASLWKEINNTRSEMRRIADERYGFMRDQLGSRYFQLAQNLYDYAVQMKLSENERKPEYKGDSLKYTVKMMFPARFDQEVEKRKLRITEKVMRIALGNDNEFVQSLFANNKGKAAVDYLFGKITVKSKEDIDNFIAKGPDAIMAINDPVMNYIKKTYDRYMEITKLEKEITETEAVYEEQLGHGLYEVYGTSIPPDGTGTLRISDGVLKSYSYNGTIAPLYTTFYGLFDRYYSFNKKFPWSLPAKWIDAYKDINLATPFTFISTHDIVGGSSGSPVINKEKEFVGIAFDGNIESNSGYFIYDTELNRMITMSALGIMESIKSVYKADRVLGEIKAGKMK